MEVSVARKDSASLEERFLEGGGSSTISGGAGWNLAANCSAVPPLAAAASPPKSFLRW